MNPKRCHSRVGSSKRTSNFGEPPLTGTDQIVARSPKLLVRFDDPTREWHRFGFKARLGRFYFTVGDRQSDVWMAESE